MKLKMCFLAVALATFYLMLTVGVAAYDGGRCTPKETPQVVETPVCDTKSPESVTECPKESPQSIVPPGKGTVIEYYIDAEGKVFYTIMTADKHVFYLIIDHDKNSQNVYFLDTVTLADLTSLADEPLPTKSGADKPKPTSTPIPEPTSSSSNTGTVVLILAVVALGGAALWYFKVYRSKQQSVRSDEYSASTSESPDEWDDEVENGDDSNSGSVEG